MSALGVVGVAGSGSRERVLAAADRAEFALDEAVAQVRLAGVDLLGDPAIGEQLRVLEAALVSVRHVCAGDGLSVESAELYVSTLDWLVSTMNLAVRVLGERAGPFGKAVEA